MTWHTHAHVQPEKALLTPLYTLWWWWWRRRILLRPASPSALINHRHKTKRPAGGPGLDWTGLDRTGRDDDRVLGVRSFVRSIGIKEKKRPRPTNTIGSKGIDLGLGWLGLGIDRFTCAPSPFHARLYMHTQVLKYTSTYIHLVKQRKQNNQAK